MGGRIGVATSAALTPGGIVLGGLRTFGPDNTQFVLARHARGRGARQIITFGGRGEVANDIASIGGHVVAVGETRRGRDSDVAIAIAS